MSQSLSGSVNPTWADQHNARYRERLDQMAQATSPNSPPVQGQKPEPRQSS